MWKCLRKNEVDLVVLYWFCCQRYSTSNILHEMHLFHWLWIVVWRRQSWNWKFHSDTLQLRRNKCIQQNATKKYLDPVVRNFKISAILMAFCHQHLVQIPTYPSHTLKKSKHGRGKIQNKRTSVGGHPSFRTGYESLTRRRSHTR